MPHGGKFYGENQTRVRKKEQYRQKCCFLFFLVFFVVVLFLLLFIHLYIGPYDAKSGWVGTISVLFVKAELQSSHPQTLYHSAGGWWSLFCLCTWVSLHTLFFSITVLRIMYLTYRGGAKRGTEKITCSFVSQKKNTNSEPPFLVSIQPCHLAKQKRQWEMDFTCKRPSLRTYD